MKVIVNFGQIAIIVPCGSGDLLVRDVIQLAIDRYKKATSKPSNSYVVVHNLKTCTDGGILDLDDRITDVADDREQIIALYEERDNNSTNNFCLSQNGNHNHSIEGTSTASESIGTESPEVFINDNNSSFNNNNNNNNNNSLPIEDINRNIANIKIQYNDVEITEDQINSGISVPLQVRRGSEPALNHLSPDKNCVTELDTTKRWSTAVAIDSKNNRNASRNSLNDIYDQSDEEKEKIDLSNSLSPRSIKEEGYGSEEKSEHTPSSTTSSNTFSRFSRGSGRLSMLANNLDVWSDAADRQLLKNTKENNQTSNNNQVNKTPSTKSSHFERGESSLSSMSSEDNTKQSNINDDSVGKIVIITLKNEAGPLGIHVLPEYDSDSGNATGLVITGIEPGGRVDRDGRMHVGDSIVEINSQNVQQMHFEKAQEVFRSALLAPDITIKLIKYNGFNQSQPPQSQLNSSTKKSVPPPVLPKPSTLPKKQDQICLDSGMVEGEERFGGQNTKVATVTPTKKLSTSSLGSNILNNHRTPTPGLTLAVANTRKIGKKYHIQLKKGNDSQGLGFSITTRDNPAGGNCPIYIKTILPKGPAVEDGRLRTGDRLLECCGIEMTGKSHSEAVSILKNIPPNTTVDLIVSRQETDLPPSPMMPRRLPSEASIDTASNEREVLTFEIPLNDTGSAGLGVSVKGKTSGTNHIDLGIFVKSVIHGGAASKDGRLKTNDQLVNINGIPLLGMSNSRAMETLRRVMIQGVGPLASSDKITLTIARRVTHPSHSLNSISNSNHQRNDSHISTTSGDSCFDETYVISSENTRQSNFDETQDSYKSNENTVIYKPFSANTNVKQITDSPTENSNAAYKNRKDYYSTESHDSSVYSRSELRNIQQSSSKERDYNYGQRTDSQSHEHGSELSLSNNHEDDDSGFQRDGFGRQSISEKRHAQLDAKNTDTYQRNKKAKEEREKQRKLIKEQMEAERSMTQVKSIETNQGLQVYPHELGKCQSPGSCPYHSTQNNTKEIGPSLGMRKSSSLESLQTMMQDLQKEQIEQTVNQFSGPRHATVRVSRARETNESFRAAVDRSITPNNLDNHETMETVAEEESESGSSLGQSHHANVQISHRPSGAISLASTQVTGTTATSSQFTTDDETAGFFRKKNSLKKKGLLKSLFKFGSSKKEKSITKKEKDTLSPTTAQIYIKEQERIQEHYRRLIEQQQQQRQQQNQIQVQPLIHSSAQPTPPQRQRSKSNLEPKSVYPLHSTPTGVPPNQTNEGMLARHERMQLLRAQHQRMHAERQGQYMNEQDIYGGRQDCVSNRPSQLYQFPLITNAHPRHMVIPKIHYNYNDNRNIPIARRSSSLRYPNEKKHQTAEVVYSRGDNYDSYRQAMERPGSRVGITDSNNKYSHYMNYREIQQQMQHYNQHNQPKNQQPIYQSYRQPMPLPNVIMRNQHQRQVSSPSFQQSERPISNYYEYESVSAMKNAAIINQHLINQQQNSNLKNDSFYSSLKRKGNNYAVDGQSAVSNSVLRQPIYQSNQIKIYGTANNPNGFNSIYSENLHQPNSQYNHAAAQYQSVRSGSKV